MSENADTLVAEETLGEALRPVRPEPWDFLEGVRRRITEREDEAGHEPSAFLKRAAAFLPPGFVPAPLSGAASTGMKLSPKALPILLTLPAVSVVMLGLTFLTALRALTRIRGAATLSDREGEELLRQWFQRHATPVALVVFTLLGLAQLFSTDIVILLLVVSMVGLVLILARMSRAGLVTRGVLGLQCGGLLSLYAVGGVFLGSVQEREGLLHPFWVPLVLVAGSVVCSSFALLGAARPRRKFRWVGLVGEVLIAAFLVPPVLVDRTLEVEDHVAFVEAFSFETSPESEEWQRIARWVWTTAGPADLSRPAAALHASLDAGESVSSYVLLHAARLDLLREEDLRALADDHGVRTLLSADSRLHLGEQTLLDVRVLLATRELDEGERDHVLSRFLQELPAEDSYKAIHKLRLACELIELLGREESASRLAPLVERVLVAAYRSEGGRACFVTNPERDANFVSTFFHTNVTDDAVDLMAFLGVPPEVDLCAVRRFLIQAARPLGVFSARYRGDHRVADVTRRKLEADFRLESPTLFETLVSERILLACVLLVALCIVAVGRAPAAPRQ